MSSRSAGYWIVLFLCLSCIMNAQSSVFDVTSYANGGKPNSDITQALANAWRDACASHSPSKVVIPRGTYKLRGALLQGPCNAPIEVHLQGDLQAPVDGYQLFQQDFWVAFRYINKHTVSGGGTFDGRSNCHKHQNCRSTRTINLRFDYVTNSMIRDITSLDSKFFHINAFQCRNITFQYITITAPEDSVNTDGIHIGRSYGVNVAHTNIRTGDDCISLGDGSKRIIVTNITCGPGHGISIGSLGKYPNEEPVVGVLVKNCTLTNTQNGLRIKTFPASPVPGSASHIHFRDITMVNVHNPILIDQEYCLDSNCGQRGPSKVKISTVSFNNIKGTSASPMLIKLLCSRKQPCENIGLTDVELKYIGGKGPSGSMCAYVKPTLTRVAHALSCSTDSMGSRKSPYYSLKEMTMVLIWDCNFVM